MASEKTWEQVRAYFRPDSKYDRWGDPKLISDEHLQRLYDFRHYIGTPIYVTAGVKLKGHSEKSFHGPRLNDKGEQIGYCATDIVIPDYDHSHFDLVLDATRFGFRGIGYYPHWSFNDTRCGGLHLDSRPLRWDKNFSVNYKHSRWMGVMRFDKNNKPYQEYIELDFPNMLTFCSPQSISINPS